MIAETLTERIIALENLKAEGRRHIETCRTICQTCEHQVIIDGAQRCSFCCCPLFFKIDGDTLTKSTCPKNKW